MKHLAAVCALAAIALAAAPAHANVSELWEGQYLFAGQRLRANSCEFTATFQADGNLVVYGHGTWSSGTANQGGYAVMQGDGNLVVYRWDGTPAWHSATFNHPHAHAVIQDDGNFVVYWGSTFALWSSGTWGEEVGMQPCPSSSVTTTEPDTNRYGGDYTGFDLSQPKPLWCAYYCAEDTRCHAYTYVPPGVQGASARCWLKSSVPGTSYAPGMMSGVILHSPRAQPPGKTDQRCTRTPSGTALLWYSHGSIVAPSPASHAATPGAR